MNYSSLKRICDVLFSAIFIVATFAPSLLIAVAIKITSRGSILYWSERVGKDNVIFDMPKFRSMKIDTPKVATHLLDNPTDYLTAIGSFLRKTSLDELPQLWSILIGDMSLVGPRPALFNQYDLIELRTQFGVDKLTPGLTGWAQINGRDNISIREKVQFDVYYLTNISWSLDLKIILLTIYYAIRRVNVSH
ncbi:sugar transferase [Polynucleobacter sp. es-GGE-1]|uniref:sugar transferase n=1 Tax=Polynucleobacter sp. es-GGE-1 TaxID=1819724 RepID=UPI001C0CAC65|nr:sugar transferase [Polynucleobacter sp. es-GGE-1]MBU3635558.1 sugar transferase [Polynucleobacter sp. es-GGE-1]